MDGELRGGLSPRPLVRRLSEAVAKRGRAYDAVKDLSAAETAYAISLTALDEGYDGSPKPMEGERRIFVSRSGNWELKKSLYVAIWRKDVGHS